MMLRKTTIYFFLAFLVSLINNGCALLERLPHPSQLSAGDPDDPCYAKQQALRTDKDYFSKILGQSFLNSVMGELPERMIKVAFGGRGSNMGDIAREVFSTELRKSTQDYLLSITKEAKGDRHVMARNINAQASSDSERLEETQYKIKKLEICRVVQRTNIDRQHRTGKIDAEEKDILYRQLLLQAQRDQRLIARVVGSSRDRVGVYIEADHYVNTGESIDADDHLRHFASKTYKIYYARKNANIRSDPSTNDPRVGGVHRGQKVQVIQKTANKNWYEINYEGTRAYIYKPLLSSAPVSSTPRRVPTTRVGQGVKKVKNAYHKTDEKKQEFDEMVVQVEQETKKVGL